MIDIYVTSAFLAMTNAAMNIHVQRFLSVFVVSLECITVSRIARPLETLCLALEEKPDCCLKWLHHLYISSLGTLRFSRLYHLANNGSVGLIGYNRPRGISVWL